MGHPVEVARWKEEDPPKDERKEAQRLSPEVTAALSLSSGASRDAELRRGLSQKMLMVHSEELRATLVRYLGSLKDAGSTPLFWSVYRSSSVDATRIAAVSALGCLGGEAVEPLRAEAQSREVSLSVRKACIHALGVARARSAVSMLIQHIEDPELGADAVRALSRISNQKLPAIPSAWIRWWRAQPDAKPEDQDPELSS
jgi:HEAT repeat protein